MDPRDASASNNFVDIFYWMFQLHASKKVGGGPFPIGGD